jgi:hypothetical protein
MKAVERLRIFAEKDPKSAIKFELIVDGKLPARHLGKENK